MSTETGEIRIYAACLAAYNNDILYGRWIDATQDVQTIMEEIAAMLRASPMDDAEEWGIHDFEGFESLSLAEYEPIGHVSELATFIRYHGRLGAKVYEYYGSIDDAEDALNDHYAGAYRTSAEFVRDMVEQSTNIPEQIQYYVDWEAMARDWEINDILAIETAFECVHVFWRH